MVTIAVAVYFRLSWPTYHDFVAAMDFCDMPFCDFVVYYYEMGQAIFRSGTPVLGYNYSPFFAIVLGVFGLFPLGFSTVLWATGIAICTAAMWYVSYMIAFPVGRTLFASSLGLFLLSFPILHNFKWGQVGVLLVLLLLGALIAYERGRWILAALFLAAAASLKYYPILFLFPFILKKDWRFLSAFVGWVVVLFVAIPILTLGIDATGSFFGQVIEGTYSKQLAAGGPNSHFFANVAVRWASLLGYEGTVSRILFRVIGLLILQFNLAVVYVLIHSKAERALQWSFVILLLSIPFLVATSWPHYLVYLPFCQLMVLSALWKKESGDETSRKVIGVAVVASIVCASVFLSQLLGGWETYNRLGFLFVANVFLLLGTFMIVVPPIIMTLRKTAPVNAR